MINVWRNIEHLHTTSFLTGFIFQGTLRTRLLQIREHVCIFFANSWRGREAVFTFTLFVDEYSIHLLWCVFKSCCFGENFCACRDLTTMVGREFECWPQHFGILSPKYDFWNCSSILLLPRKQLLSGNPFFRGCTKCKLVERVKLVALAAGQHLGFLPDKYIWQLKTNTFCTMRQIQFAIETGESLSEAGGARSRAARRHLGFLWQSGAAKPNLLQATSFGLDFDSNAWTCDQMAKVPKKKAMKKGTATS